MGKQVWGMRLTVLIVGLVAMGALADGAASLAGVKPGLRIITHQADASIPGSRMVLVQSPDGKLINKATGQTFNLEAAAGGGGQGFGIVDIVSVLPDAVVAQVRTFLLM